MGTKHAFRFLHCMMLVSLLAGAGSLAAQEGASQALSPSPNALADSVRELRDQVRELQAAMAEMRSETQRARAETLEMRRELEEVRAQSGSRNAVIMEAVARTGAAKFGSIPMKLHRTKSDRIRKARPTATLDERYELLSGKVDDQYQTKVESASKLPRAAFRSRAHDLFSNSEP